MNTLNTFYDMTAKVKSGLSVASQTFVKTKVEEF